MAQGIFHSRGEEGIQFNSNILWKHNTVCKDAKDGGFYKWTVILDIPRTKLRWRKLKVLPRRSLSPDLNIIENLRIDFKRVAPARRPRNLTELEDFHKEELAKIPQTRTERFMAAKKKCSDTF